MAAVNVAGRGGLMLPARLYLRGALELAPALLGCELVHVADGEPAAGIIVETEAYRQDDEASHSFRGQTPRNAVMFGPGGHAYVYFTYGMHYCFNVVAGTEGWAEAVLIRALEPTQGVATMQRRRGTTDLHSLCSGPAKLVQALGITRNDNGARLTTPEFHICRRNQAWQTPTIVRGPRIGIRQAVDRPWRFFIAKNLYVTKHLFNKAALPLEAWVDH